MLVETHPSTYSFLFLVYYTQKLWKSIAASTFESVKLPVPSAEIFYGFFTWLRQLYGKQ
jgi:hypothetical protein